MTLTFWKSGHTIFNYLSYLWSFFLILNRNVETAVSTILTDSLINKVLIFCYSLTFQEVSANQNDSADNEAVSNVTPSDSVTKTTLDDLFETLKKLEEEEQLATARPEKKNAWCKTICVT